MIKEENLLKFESLSRFSDIEHFTTTRHGGVSIGNFCSLNGSPYSGDRLEDVLENQRRICAQLSDRSYRIILPYQEHGVKIVEIDKSFLEKSLQQQESILRGVDALITRCSSTLIAVSTADCVPILLYDSNVKGIAAIHAGWRGTVNRIAQKVVLQMADAWGSVPSGIYGAIAPSISAEAFEVGDEVYHTFEENGFPMQRIAKLNQCTKRWHIDLWEANIWQLEEVGLVRQRIEVSGHCTYREHFDFFSARRLTIRSGRNLTGICLR